MDANYANRLQWFRQFKENINASKSTLIVPLFSTFPNKSNLRNKSRPSPFYTLFHEAFNRIFKNKLLTRNVKKITLSSIRLQKGACKEMQQLTIRMPEKYFSKIEQIAKSSGLKKSDVTRMAIRKFLEEYSSEQEADLYSKAKRLIGVVESGISDLGQNHREYFIKKIKAA
jgi:predicted DNA-binding protein